jgi:hypothetical protein
MSYYCRNCKDLKFIGNYFQAKKLEFLCKSCYSKICPSIVKKTIIVLKNCIYKNRFYFYFMNFNLFKNILTTIFPFFIICIFSQFLLFLGVNDALVFLTSFASTVLYMFSMIVTILKFI